MSDKELEGLIKLIEEENKLAILYYQAYQEKTETKLKTEP